MLYARSDVHGFGGYGGCAGHTEPADPDVDLFSIDCGQCEEFLRTDQLWAASPDEVQLTVAEQKRLDAEAHQAQLGAAQLGLVFQELLRDKAVTLPAAPAAADPPKRRTTRTAKAPAAAE